jgi:hypothetical protein
MLARISGHVSCNAQRQRVSGRVYYSNLIDSNFYTVKILVARGLQQFLLSSEKYKKILLEYKSI